MVNGIPVHHIRKMTTTQNLICFQIKSVELNISSSIVDDVVVDDSEWDKCVMCPSTVIWSDDLLDEKQKTMAKQNNARKTSEYAMHFGHEKAGEIWLFVSIWRIVVKVKICLNKCAFYTKWNRKKEHEKRRKTSKNRGYTFTAALYTKCKQENSWCAINRKCGTNKWNIYVWK